MRPFTADGAVVGGVAGYPAGMWMRRWVAGGLGGVALCLGVFGALWTAAWLLVGTGILGAGRAARWGWRGGGLLLWLGVGVGYWPTPFLEYAARTQALLSDPSWDVRDRAGVWVLNVGMALGGALVGCPEAALETLLLIVPDLDKDGKRVFQSSFPVGSSHVQAALQAWRQGNPRGTPGPLPAQRVAWRYDRMGWSETRYALALNSVSLTGDVRVDPETGARRLSTCATVAVSYWPTTTIPLFSVRGQTVALEEGLYWRLQQEGWLFPYDAAWCWEEPWSASAP